MFAVIVVGLSTTTPVAGTPPIVTVAPGSKREAADPRPDDAARRSGHFYNERGKYNRFLFLGMTQLLMHKIRDNDDGFPSRNLRQREQRSKSFS